MSYEFSYRGRAIGEVPDARAVLSHRGDYRALVDRHLDNVQSALRDGIRGVRSLAPHLIERIGDSRTMRVAWDYLARHGGGAPGHDDRRYADFSNPETWDFCRALAKAVRDGTYARGQETVRLIDKGPGRGQRPLIISNIADRVVERAIVTIIQPVLDPLFEERSYGYRPRKGHLRALAEAERLVLQEQRRVWLVADIRDAFLNVPIPRLLQVVRKFLPADDLIDLLGSVLAGNPLPGLRQGGPISPLLLNVYLHHVLDRPWRQQNPTLPLLRMADDLLVCCRSESQAREAHAQLLARLVPAGFTLKNDVDEAVHELRRDTPVEWLGFAINRPARGVRYDIAEKSWERLSDRLAVAHAKSSSPIRARQVVEGWLSQRGPCFTGSDRGAVCERVIAIARAHAFDEIQSLAQLDAIWKRAGKHWNLLRRAARQAPPDSASSAPASDRSVRRSHADADDSDPSGPPFTSTHRGR